MLTARGNSQSPWLMSRNAAPTGGEVAVVGKPAKASCTKSPRTRQDLATLLGPTFKSGKKNSSLNAKHNKECEGWKMQRDFLSHKPQSRLGEFAEKINYPHKISGQGRISSPFCLRQLVEDGVTLVCLLGCCWR